MKVRTRPSSTPFLLKTIILFHFFLSLLERAFFPLNYCCSRGHVRSNHSSREATAVGFGGCTRGQDLVGSLLQALFARKCVKKV